MLTFARDGDRIKPPRKHLRYWTMQPHAAKTESGWLPLWKSLVTALNWTRSSWCAFMTPTEHRLAMLTFAAGASLGYFLELGGTTRACWTYYTQQTPPLFAVLAHGMAAVAFWRTGLLVRFLYRRADPDCGARVRL